MINMTQLSRIFVVLLLAASVGCVAAEQQPRDCSRTYIDTRISLCTQVRRASEFPGCLSADNIDGHTCLVMDADLTFCPDQPDFAITAMFDQSDKTLDCAGGVIDHGWGRFAVPGQTPATTEQTRLPGVRFIDDRSLSNITVRNCTIRGTHHMGIQLTRYFGGDLGGDGQLDSDEALPVGHRNILFEDLKIQDVRLGIYLGNFSENITIQRVHIDSSERIAIYSEAGSHNVTIADSIITNNRTREAVAIDSTYDSEIRNTLFVNNREGGINLYQNCGELKGTVCPIIRPTTPSNNRIVDNMFINTGVSGVQVASRQGRNHTKGWCATLDGQAGKFTDTAENNVVEGNIFICHEGTSLVLMDGPNLIRNNRVIARKRCVPYEVSTGGLGREARSRLNGLRLQGNHIDSTRPPRLRNVGDGVTID